MASPITSTASQQPELQLSQHLLSSAPPTTSTFQQQQEPFEYYTIIDNVQGHSTQHQEPSQPSNILLGAMSQADLAAYSTVDVPVDMEVVTVGNLEVRIASLENTVSTLNENMKTVINFVMNIEKFMKQLGQKEEGNTI